MKWVLPSYTVCVFATVTPTPAVAEARAGPVNVCGRSGMSASVCVSQDTTVRVWDMTTGVELRSLGGHRQTVTAVILLTAEASARLGKCYIFTSKLFYVAYGEQLIVQSLCHETPLISRDMRHYINLFLVDWFSGTRVRCSVASLTLCVCLSVSHSML